MPKKNFIVRDPQDLNLHFYDRYDESFLFKKAEMLWLIVDKQDEFKKFIEQNGGKPENINQEYIDALRAEIHFTELHQFEAFFALLTAIFQDGPHWIYLTTYPPGDMKKKAQMYLDRDIKGLTNGQCKTRTEFIELAIYLGFLPDEADVWTHFKSMPPS